MTFGAMRHRLGQVLAPVPSFAAVWIGSDRLTVEVQKLPEAYKAPDLERKRQLVRRRFASNCGQRTQVGHEVADVAEAHLGVARIGKGRVIARSRRRQAATQRR